MGRESAPQTMVTELLVLLAYQVIVGGQLTKYLTTGLHYVEASPQYPTTSYSLHLGKAGFPHN